MTDISALHDYVEPTIVKVIQKHGKRAAVSQLVDPVYELIDGQMKSLDAGQTTSAQPTLAASASAAWRELSVSERKAFIRELLGKYRAGQMTAGCFSGCASWLVALIVIALIVMGIRAIW